MDDSFNEKADEIDDKNCNTFQTISPPTVVICFRGVVKKMITLRAMFSKQSFIKFCLNY